MSNLKQLSHELDGVVADVEQGDGFDEVCLATVKRVRDALARAGDKAQPVATQRDRLLAALERSAKAESMLRSLVDECDNDSVEGWEDRMRAIIECANRLLSSTSQPPAEHGDDVHDAETELNCAEEVLDAIAVGLDMEETAFDCICDYITAVVNTIMKPAMRGAQFTDADLEPPEQLAGRLIDAWCATHGKQIPWAKAVEISAIITKMPDSERERLLNL